MKARARGVWVRLHRWLGLGLLAFWLVIGLTGSVLVVYRECLMAWHHQPEAAVESAASPEQLDGARDAVMQGVAPDAVWQALRQAHPQRQGGWRLEWPMQPGEAVVARYMKPTESAGRAFAPLMVWVQAGSARIEHQAIWGDEPLTWLYDLHYSLLLDLPGRQVVGVLGVLMSVSVLSGLVLWWPRPRWASWRQALSFKRGASAVRRVYDWHKLMGASSALLLLMLAITGAMLTWHQPLEGLLAKRWQLFSAPRVEAQGPPVVPLNDAVKTALARFPGASLRWVEAPPLAGGHIRVQMYQDGEPSRRFPKTQVWVDASTGEVLAVRDGLNQSVGDAVMSWLHPLHNGEVAGWPGRLLILACGLAPVGLGLTGWLRWRHKRLARLSQLAKS
jgi:uncharacterized iron-regulated membrane protein